MTGIVNPNERLPLSILVCSHDLVLKVVKNARKSLEVSLLINSYLGLLCSENSKKSFLDLLNILFSLWQVLETLSSWNISPISVVLIANENKDPFVGMGLL